MQPVRTPRYEFVRDRDEPAANDRSALPFGVYLRHAQGGEERLWVRTKSVTKKKFYCVMGWHQIEAKTERCYKPPMGAGRLSRDRVCESCVTQARNNFTY